VSRAKAAAARAERDARAEAMYRDGSTLTTIGAELGVTPSLLSMVLRARGVPMRRGGCPPPDDALLATCLRMISEGRPRAEIAAACERSESWVRLIAAEAGVEYRVRRKRPEVCVERNNEVERLYREGVSLKGIRARLGIDVSQAHRILRARGVPMRPRGAPKGATAPVAAAIADVLAGVPYAAAAAAHSVDSSSVYRRVPVSALRAAPQRRGRCKRSQVRAALADVRAGASLSEASTRHGVTLPTLRRYVCGPWL